MSQLSLSVPGLALVSLLLAACQAVTPAATVEPVAPLHLDDIHFIVQHEDEAVSFFQEHFGAREMAHPGERFDLVRFLSVKWQDPTLTITRIGPYDDLPPDRNARWENSELVLPSTAKDNPYYGVRWLAFAVPSLEAARERLRDAGVALAEPKVRLPMEPSARAFSVYGPDGAELVIVERASKDFGGSSFAIDHLQFLTADAGESRAFFEGVFNGVATEVAGANIALKVADATLILSEPEAFGYDRSQVSPASRSGVIQLGIGHLGFLYEDIQAAVDQAARNGYTPVFQPTAYIYKNKPTLYRFTAFATPDNFNIEMVQVRGRVGPHSYYCSSCRAP